MRNMTVKLAVYSILGYSDIGILGYWDIGIFGCSHIWIFTYWDIRILAYCTPQKSFGNAN